MDRPLSEHQDTVLRGESSPEAAPIRSKERVGFVFVLANLGSVTE